VILAHAVGAAVAAALIGQDTEIAAKVAELV
jgi:hypothetical protein